VREDEITAWFAGQRKLSADIFPIGIGDDMAQVRLAGEETVLITTDMLLDGVHFDLSKTTLSQAAYKAMAVNLSDCAAMATLPVAAVVSVALPKGFRFEELKEIHKGISQASDKYDCALIGGDITVWKDKEPFVISVSMISKCAGVKPLRRSGAKVGDSICVTGFLGGSDLGRHLNFEPRIKEARRLAQLCVINSMIDLSDGLSSDLNRICQQSRVGAVIEASAIPVSNDAKKKRDPLKSALNDGEDFELLFTLSEEQFVILCNSWDQTVPVTRIGTITDTGRMQIRTLTGAIENLEPGGYDHFDKSQVKKVDNGL
jgi:thiamine-monophosphate kinase